MNLNIDVRAIIEMNPRSHRPLIFGKGLYSNTYEIAICFSIQKLLDDIYGL